MKTTTSAKLALSVLAGMVVAAAAMPAHAATEWVMLGEQPVSTSADRDVLIVGGDEGRFEALKFEVQGNRVHFGEVRVVYRHGESEVLDVKEHMRPGQTSPSYDLKGTNKVIKRIEFLYQAGTGRRWDGSPAIVKVLGKKDMGMGSVSTGCNDTGGWRVLGVRDVNLTVDHDTIALGYEANRYRALRFHVSGAPIHLYDVRVTFGTGEVQTLNFDERIEEGSYSRTYDLPGRERMISRIDLVYKKSHRGEQQAKMTVYGLS
jgi:hypothetical protein